MTGSSPIYARYPLRQDEVRVLLLQPASAPEAPIRCELQVVSLLEARPEWSALSYTWGPPIKGQHLDDKQIIIAGQSFTVTGNLFDALTTFRWALRARQMWVDAICINQDDLAERSQQVALMADIYQQATSVLVWLGHDSPYLDALVTFTLLKTLHRRRDSMNELRAWIEDCGDDLTFDEFDRRFVDIISQPTMPFLLLRTSQTWPLIEEAATRLQEQGSVRNLNILKTRHPAIVTICTLMQQLFDRRYFSRRWVLQEVYHGKFTEIICGKQSMMWYMLRTAHDSLWELNERVGKWKAPTHYQIPASPTPLVGTAFRTGQPDELPAQGILNLLFMFNSAECEDDRDRLFSVLSFERGFQFLPDYTMSASQVWLQFARVCIQVGLFQPVLNATLNQIGDLRDGFRRRLDLQSWVPDLGIMVKSGSRGADKIEVPGAATHSTVDAHGRLSCSLFSFGTIEIHNGWAILGPNIPADVLAIVRGLHTGPDTIPLVDLQARRWPKLVALDGESRLQANNFTDLAVWTSLYMDAARRSSESGPSGLFDGDLLCKTISGGIAHDLFAIRPGPELTDAGEQIYTVVGRASWGYWNKEDQAPAGELRRFLIA
jgi:hypothetical protein